MTSTTEQRRAIGSATSLDAVGWCFLLVLFAWLVLGTILAGGSWGGVALYVAPAVGFILGRLAGQRSTRGSLAMLLLVATAPLVWAWPDVIRDDPFGRPLGYDNATAAFAVQAQAVALVLAYESRTWPGRVAAAAASFILAAIPFLVDSTAGSVLATILFLAGPIGASVGMGTRFRWAIISSFLVVLSTTIVVAIGYGGPNGAPLPEPLPSLLTERRITLWSEAAAFAGADPVLGIGLGQFDASSATVKTDPDTPTAHNAFLQLSAEAGVVAGVMLASLFVWAVVLASVSAGVEAPAAATTAVAIAALAIHACVDHVVETPGVAALSATLLGIVTATRIGSRSAQAPLGEALPQEMAI